MNNLVIRFKKKGYKNHYVFDIVLVDRRVPVNSGKYIEKLGYYNPHASSCFESKVFIIDVERLSYWISKNIFVMQSVKKKLIKFLV